LSDKIRIIYC